MAKFLIHTQALPISKTAFITWGWGCGADLVVCTDMYQQKLSTKSQCYVLVYPEQIYTEVKHCCYSLVSVFTF